MARIDPKKTAKDLNELERIAIVRKCMELGWNKTQTYKYYAKRGPFISRNTINSFVSQYKHMFILEEKETEKLVDDALKSIQNTTEIIRRYENLVREKTIKRMLQLISQEENLSKLNETYKTLTDIINAKPADDTSKSVSFIEQYNQVININNGKSENRVNGDVQDVTPVNEPQRIIARINKSKEVQRSN